mmetsp:Transcript_27779/g.65964  ORF Transcript_27779/g.65964 Transcript_27779/m.65964 type:complete len:253 (+) Transcript_27779:608-1366(+)
MVLSGSMMWIVIRSSSSRPKRLVFLSSKKEELPLRMSVRKPASILSESIVVSPSNLLRLVLAMSLRMRRRESSDWDAAVPTTMSALATSTRSVLARTPSQKMLMPPSTTGMEPKSVVLTCSGSHPWLGLSQPLESSALITMCTNTFCERSLDGSGYQSTPSGILYDTKLSGVEIGLTHMLAPGAQSWHSLLLKSPQHAKSLGGVDPGNVGGKARLGQLLFGLQIVHSPVSLLNPQVQLSQSSGNTTVHTHSA